MYQRSSELTWATITLGTAATVARMRMRIVGSSIAGSTARSTKRLPMSKVRLSTFNSTWRNTARSTIATGRSVWNRQVERNAAAKGQGTNGVDDSLQEIAHRHRRLARLFLDVDDLLVDRLVRAVVLAGRSSRTVLNRAEGVAIPEVCRHGGKGIIAVATRLSEAYAQIIANLGKRNRLNVSQVEVAVATPRQGGVW